MEKKTIKDVELKNKVVLIRVDFNVPMKNGVITDDNRIVQALPTIKYALEQDAKLVLFSHLGRIKTEEDKAKNTLAPVAKRLAELLNKEVTFIPEEGKSCPTEILQAIAELNAEGRPIWKPMHLQPVFEKYDFISGEEGKRRVGEDIFNRGLCLPSDIKNTHEDMERIIDIVRGCFGR